GRGRGGPRRPPGARAGAPAAAPPAHADRRGRAGAAAPPRGRPPRAARAPSRARAPRRRGWPATADGRTAGGGRSGPAAGAVGPGTGGAWRASSLGGDLEALLEAGVDLTQELTERVVLGRGDPCLGEL